MHERKRQWLSTGEFARLCGVSKDTLFYYDRIGILKPGRKLENGYRGYAAEQFFDYDLIRVLRQAGSSLGEIRAYLAHYDTAHFLALFREKHAQIAAQRRRLEQMERMLAHTVETTERALRERYDEPRVERQAAELLLPVRLDRGDGDRVERIAARLAEHFAQCERCGVADKFPLGSVILREEVLAGGEEEAYFFSRVPDDFTGGEVLRKPAGAYATVVCRGDYGSFSKSYGRLLGFIQTEKLTVCGNAYVYDLVSYLASAGQQTYVYQISVQVEAG